MSGDWQLWGSRAKRASGGERNVYACLRDSPRLQSASKRYHSSGSRERAQEQIKLEQGRERRSVSATRYDASVTGCDTRVKFRSAATRVSVSLSHLDASPATPLLTMLEAKLNEAALLKRLLDGTCSLSSPWLVLTGVQR